MRVLVANVVYSNRPERVRHNLHELIRDHKPDVLMLCETKNVDLRRMLPDWRVHQGRAVFSRRNAAVCWRLPVWAGRRRFIYGTDARDILTRWITRVRLAYGQSGRVGFDTMHLAPGRDEYANRTYLRQIERHSANRWKVWAGDMNESEIPALALRHGLQLVRRGVMFLATNLEVLSFTADRVRGFDHDVLIVDLEPAATT